MTGSMSSKAFAKTSFANPAQAQYIEDLYSIYKKDPSGVEKSWADFFSGYELALHDLKSKPSHELSHESAQVEALINTYRRLGHLSADINPLEKQTSLAEELMLEFHGLEQSSLPKIFHPANLPGGKPMPLQEIVTLLQDTYTRTLGVEFRDIDDVSRVLWLQDTMESCRNKPPFPLPLRKRIFKKLVEAEGLEKFLHARYLGQKRFSVEGLEALIPTLDVMLNEGKRLGVSEACLGMAHRGRINVLINVLGKPIEKLFVEFEDTEVTTEAIEGDVKYHKGFAAEIDTFDQGSILCYLAPNPSHLESVNPVVEGFVHARQDLLKDVQHKKALPILLHGDAAFMGQGIVAETLNLAVLPEYSTGGTIHIITNNQVGFTTDPKESRSTTYASGIAKILSCPIFHVNADDVEKCVWAMIMAIAYRQKFGKDVVIDIVGYRRHGHNETDEPSFTQPKLYEKIKTHPTALEVYAARLRDEGVFTEAEIEAQIKDHREYLQKKYELVHSGAYKMEYFVLPEKLKHSLFYVKPSYEDIFASVKTGVPQTKLNAIATQIMSIPDDFKIHPKLTRLIESRKNMLTPSGHVDWAFAELLAFASLADENFNVRLTGQDVQRGTFSSRHAVLKDNESGKAYNIFSPLGEKARVEIINSPLSELSCLGFEYGFSVADYMTLVLWEAQFGDFCNGAQIIIDQFIAASEAKWKQVCGLVLLLPHGYEGQGPEHSSARLERFLQLCGNYNMQVVNLTTPANYFHALRRQMHRSFRKPLVVMSPKSLLRRPEAVSIGQDFYQGSFQDVIGDTREFNESKVSSVLICSGKIYYEIMEIQAKDTSEPKIPVIRMEQIYPFPDAHLKLALSKYSGLKEIRWVQEEPQNMGAWSFMRPYLESLPNSYKVNYFGRTYSGTTAEGSFKAHHAEQQRIIMEALKV